MLEELLEKLRKFLKPNTREAQPQEDRGLIEVEPEPDDYVLGGDTEAVKPVIQSDRDWSLYLPVKELQNRGFETMACVSFSRNNCIEVMLHKLFDKKVNYSDRFMAKVSNTSRNGNSMNRVAQAGRKFGSVPEKVYPWGGRGWGEYYQNIPAEVLKIGEDLLMDYEFQYEWVDWGGCDPEKLWEGLQYSPIQVSVFAYPWRSDGVYQRSTARPNHAVMLFKGEYKKFWYIYDSYENTVKKLAWNFYFGSAMRHVVKKKRMLELIKGTDNPKVFALDAKQVARHIVDEKQFEIGREAGLWSGWDSVRTITQKRMDEYEKGEPIVFLAN